MSATDERMYISVRIMVRVDDASGHCLTHCGRGVRYVYSSTKSRPPRCIHQKRVMRHDIQSENIIFNTPAEQWAIKSKVHVNLEQEMSTMDQHRSLNGGQNTSFVVVKNKAIDHNLLCDT